MKIDKKFKLLISLLIPALMLFGSYITMRTYPAQWLPVERAPVVEAVYGLGTVTSNRIYHLKLGTTASILKLMVNEGEQVKTGQQLVEFTDMIAPKAPFSGTITDLPVNVGETVYPQTNVLTLVDLSQRYLLVSLEQQAALKVRPGQVVKISFESMRDTNLTGVVQSIYPNNNNFYVKIDVPNLPPQVLPDMTADVAIVIKQSEETFVPSQAVHDKHITVLENNVERTIPVTIGSIEGKTTEIIAPELATDLKVKL